MNNKFLITESERNQIKKLYNITEIDSAKALQALDQLVNKFKSDSSDKKSEDDTTNSSNSSTPTDPIKELNDNENIVFKQLKEDGFTDEAAAAVMGVVGGESGFKTFKESSYSTTSNSRIRAIFGSKLGKYSDEQLNKIKKSDEDFFNAVYGGLYGNAPNEGYKYVGRGFNGITFKGNYEAAKKCTGIDFVGQPELLEDPKYAAKALSCYFKKIKEISEFEPAFREAFRENAGPGNSWEYYANSTNPVAVHGIPLKRGKAEQYYKKIKEKQSN
jgi:putative chitinase